MKRLLMGCLVFAGCISLGGCGGEESIAEKEVTTEVAAPKRANNPLASQQALLRDARGIQAILDADAEKKKKALEESN